jgi:diguanylate cyclase (GGDEF)-like protein
LVEKEDLTLSRLKTIQAYFAVREDPYAGADMANAQRLGSLLWGLLLFLIVFLWFPSPPNEAIGDAGWVVAGAIAACAAFVVWALRHRRVITTWGRMLAISYAGVFAIAVLQWLAGGIGSPYERVFLLPILFVAMLHPPRRIFPFLGFVLLALIAPSIYDGWSSDEGGSVVAGFAIWSILAVLGNVLMTGVRAQRVALAGEEAKAREEARVDKLTGLHNRRGFDEMLALEVARAHRSGAPLTVAMVDVHSYKQINDQWGHAEGDRCLREVALSIGEAVREPDLCFRWGGDEFALILAGSSAGDVGPLGVRLANVIDRECRRPDHEPMEIAFAVTELQPDMTAEELGDMAGMALTAAKSHSDEGLPDLEERGD